MWQKQTPKHMKWEPIHFTGLSLKLNFEAALFDLVKIKSTDAKCEQMLCVCEQQNQKKKK